MGRHIPDQPRELNTASVDRAEAKARSVLGSRVAKIVGLGVGTLLVVSCVNDLASGGPTPPQPTPVVAAAAPTTTVPASTYRYAPPPTTTTSYTSPSFDTPAWGTNPEQVTVTRVVDGDTFEVSDGRKIRVLGIDSCEMSTDMGDMAKLSAESVLLRTNNATITLTSEPGVDTDRYDRHLRYVDIRSSVSNRDLGLYMVENSHTAVYDGDNDASTDYVRQLRAEDPEGRTCDLPDTSSSDVDIDVDDDDDRNLPDGALTGGYCARKWWC